MGSSQPIPLTAPFAQEFRPLANQLVGFAAEPFNPFYSSIEQSLADEREQARRRLYAGAQRAGAFASTDRERLDQELEKNFAQALGGFRFGQLESAQNRALGLLSALQGQPQLYAPSAGAQVIGGLGSLLGPLGAMGALRFRNPITLGK